jgi:putative spermidine/putrescine transport system permease protein
MPNIVGGKTQLIGNLIARTLLAPNQPLAAAFTLWPIIIIVVYLATMSRLKAFDNL